LGFGFFESDQGERAVPQKKAPEKKKNKVERSPKMLSYEKGDKMEGWDGVTQPWGRCN